MLAAAVTAVWVLIFGGLLAFEVFTIRHPSRGDTLSEHVWRFRATLWGRPALYALWGWLTWHFIVDEFWPGASATPADDWLVVGVCAAAGLGVAAWRWQARR